MFRKLLLIAFVCVSFAQVHGSELDDAITNGIRKVAAMNENVKERLREATQDANEKIQLIQYKTAVFVRDVFGESDSAKLSLNKVANAMERKAENNPSCPNTVLECIRNTERKAIDQMEASVMSFLTDLDGLRRSELTYVNGAIASSSEMRNELQERFMTTVKDLSFCQSLASVQTTLDKFSTYVNNFQTDIFKVQEQGVAALANFQRNSINYFRIVNRQIYEIKYIGIRNIRDCYYKRPRDLISKHSQESQQSQES